MLGTSIHVCFSQELQTIAEAVFSLSQQEYSPEQLEFLQEKRINPIDINSLQEQELSQFCFLTPFEQKSVWEYIRVNKPLKTIYELQLVLGLPLEKAQLLSQFFEVSPVPTQPSLHQLIQGGEHTLHTSFQTPISTNGALVQNQYEGSLLKHAWRYRYDANNALFWGITYKKDIGEELSFAHENVYDYTSAYIQYKPNSIVSNIVVGDYELQVAQGLMQWQGGYFGKQIRSQHMEQHSTLKKHSSGNEIDFYRGVAAQVDIKQWCFTPFVSHKYIDGKIHEDSSSFMFYTTGYHRTKTEIQYARNILHSSKGLLVQYQWRGSTLSSGYIHHDFLCATFETTQDFMNIAYSYRRKHTNFFAESSYDFNASAHSVGIQTAIARDISLASVVRYYQLDYSNMFSQAISEQSAIQNEQGIFTHIVFPIATHISLQCVHDYYYMPAPRYFVPSPTRGNELYVKLQYSNWDGIRMYYAWSNAYKTQQSSTDTIHNEIYTHITQFHKFYIAIPFQDIFVLKTTIALSAASINRGTLFCQDIVCKPIKNCNVRVRYAHFSAPYSARIYAWEDNVEYSITSRQYFNKGSQWYTMIEWQMNNEFRIEFKASHTAITKQYTQSETSQPSSFLCNAAIRCSIR